MGVVVLELSTCHSARTEHPIVLRVQWPRSWPPKAHPPLLFSFPPHEHFCPRAMAISSDDMKAMTDTLMSMMAENNAKIVCLLVIACLQLGVNICGGVLMFAS